MNRRRYISSASGRTVKEPVSTDESIRGFTPRRLLMTEIGALLSNSIELDDVRRRIGEPLVARNDEMAHEVTLLLDILVDLDRGASRPPMSLPEPPHVRERVEKECKMAVHNVREAGKAHEIERDAKLSDIVGRLECGGGASHDHSSSSSDDDDDDEPDDNTDQFYFGLGSGEQHEARDEADGLLQVMEALRANRLSLTRASIADTAPRLRDALRIEQRLLQLDIDFLQQQCVSTADVHSATHTTQQQQQRRHTPPNLVELRWAATRLQSIFLTATPPQLAREHSNSALPAIAQDVVPLPPSVATNVPTASWHGQIAVRRASRVKSMDAESN